MLRTVIIALATLGLVLTTNFIFSPVKATTTDLELYTWGYPYVGSNQVVCKQIVTHPKQQPMPKSSQMQPVKIHSTIVSDRYCGHLTKPAQVGA
ncbi:MAG: hypothetical protein F6K47_02565 [Symploca sp. SIO2E6]|nr:hypothetical protein [Symploca sp. SIO2E6]